MRDFAPFTITWFHLRDGLIRIVTTAAGNIEESDTSSHGYFWLQTLTLYSVVPRAGEVHFVPDSRLCYHRECPEYAPNYCNAYPFVPENFRQCKFTEKVQKLRKGMKKI